MAGGSIPSAMTRLRALFQCDRSVLSEADKGEYGGVGQMRAVNAEHIIASVPTALVGVEGLAHVRWDALTLACWASGQDQHYRMAGSAIFTACQTVDAGLIDGAVAPY